MRTPAISETTSYSTGVNSPRASFFVLFLALGVFLTTILPHRASRIASYDGDTFLHTLYGNIIVAESRIPTVDPVSFLPAEHSLVLHSWLAEIFFGVVYSFSGLTGLLLIAAIVYALTMCLLFNAMLKRGGTELLAILVTGLAFIGSQPHLFLRPHIFGWGLAVLYVDLLMGLRQKHAKEDMIALSACMALWCNVHPSFLVGIGVHLITTIMAFVLRAPYRAQLALSFFVCALSSLLNPYGFGLFQHLSGFLLARAQSPAIEEYGPTIAAPWAFGATIILALVVLATIARSRKAFQQPGHYSAILLCLISLLVFRFAAITLLIAPLLLWEPRQVEVRPSSSGLMKPLLVLLLAAISLLLFHYRVEVDPSLQPTTQLSENRILQCPRLISEFKSSGYVAFRSWPRSKSAITGMSFETMPSQAQHYAQDTGGWVHQLQSEYHIPDECVVF